MERGQACRNIEDDGWEDASYGLAAREIAGSAALTPSPVPESGPRRCRSTADTLPVRDPAEALAGARPDWCVDVGASLLPMTTFELWSAIERADVAPWMRVWREGLECWTPVQELPELRWAAACAVMRAPSASLASPDVLPTPPAPANQGGSRPDAERDGAPWAAAPTPLPSEVTPAPVAARAPDVPSGGGWLVTGSVVAALAICGALLHATAVPPSPPVAAHAAAVPADIASTAEAEVPAPAPEAVPPMLRAGAATAPARHEERGQRRMPRGGRRAQGR